MSLSSIEPIVKDIRNQWYYRRTDHNEYFAMSNKRVQSVKPWISCTIMNYHEEISSKSWRNITEIMHYHEKIYHRNHALSWKNVIEPSVFSLYFMYGNLIFRYMSCRNDVMQYLIQFWKKFQQPCDGRLPVTVFFSSQFPTAYTIFQRAGTHVVVGIVQFFINHHHRLPVHFQHRHFGSR